MIGPDSNEHRRQRELLGSYVLGSLPSADESGLQAHLDGCAACRAELAELVPLVADLQGVDPDALSDLPVPPVHLGNRIRARVAEERELVQAREQREHRHREVRQGLRRLVTAAAAAMVLAAAVGGGAALGRGAAPQVVAGPPARLVEQVDLRALDGQVQVEQARIVAHSWGVEMVFAADGFVDGATYQAAFRGADGGLVPAGAFLGTGEEQVTCNMQSALLREDTTGFVVVDAGGNEVLTVEL